MNFELFGQFIEEHGSNPSLIFKAWSGGDNPVIFVTFCHFCYDSKKNTIPDYWRGIRVDKIKGIWNKGMSVTCKEHE